MWDKSLKFHSEDISLLKTHCQNREMTHKTQKGQLKSVVRCQSSSRWSSKLKPATVPASSPSCCCVNSKPLHLSSALSLSFQFVCCNLPPPRQLSSISSVSSFSSPQLVLHPSFNTAESRLHHGVSCSHLSPHEDVLMEPNCSRHATFYPGLGNKKLLIQNKVSPDLNQKCEI